MVRRADPIRYGQAHRQMRAAWAGLRRERDVRYHVDDVRGVSDVDKIG